VTKHRKKTGSRAKFPASSAAVARRDDRPELLAVLGVVHLPDEVEGRTEVAFA
jgi:hypothetical protein